MKISEIKSLRGLLRNARDVMSDAGDLVRPSDADQAARIKNITHRISDEIDITDRKLADAERREGGG